MDATAMNSTNGTIVNMAFNITASCTLPVPTTRIVEYLGSLLALIPILAYPFFSNPVQVNDVRPVVELGRMAAMSLATQLSTYLFWHITAVPIANYQPWVLPLNTLCFIVYLWDKLTPHGSHPYYEALLKMVMWCSIAYALLKTGFCHWDGTIARLTMVTLGLVSFFWFPDHGLTFLDELMTELLDRLQPRDVEWWWWLPDEFEGEEHPAWATKIGRELVQWHGLLFCVWGVVALWEAEMSQSVAEQMEETLVVSWFTCFCG